MGGGWAGDVGKKNYAIMIDSSWILISGFFRLARAVRWMCGILERGMGRSIGTAIDEVSISSGYTRGKMRARGVLVMTKIVRS